MIQLRREGRPPLAIGHKGAAALAPENTLASLEAAVAAGVDVVEFDVLERPGGELALGHSLRETPAAPLAFAEALAWFAGQRCGLHVDVKGVGFEDRIVAAVAEHGLDDRTYVSTTRPPSVRRFAALAPELPRALTYPEDRYGVSRMRFARPAIAGAAATLRRALPARIGGLLRRAHASVASLEHTVVTRATVDRCHALGVPVIVWTVDDAARVEQLVALGVDGIVSNDPRILAATLSP